MFCGYSVFTCRSKCGDSIVPFLAPPLSMAEGWRVASRVRS